MVVYRGLQNLCSKFWLEIITIILTTSVVAVIVSRGISLEGDTVALVDSANALTKCFRSRQFHGCPGSYHFGLIQHVPAFAMQMAGLSPKTTVEVLGLINLAFFPSFVASLWLFLKPALRPYGVLLVFAGPLVVYAGSSFGELLQSVVFVYFAVAVFKKNRPLILLMGILAASTRESAFVALIFVVVAIAVSDGWREVLKKRLQILWGFAGIFLGLVLIEIFNLWRFDSLSNPTYTSPLLFTRQLSTNLSSFFGLWFAPGGGVLVFWLVSGLICLFVPVCSLCQKSPKKRESSIAILINLTLATATLATWFSPFGWNAWGPRLLIPTIAMIGFVTLLLFEEVIGELKKFYSKHRIAYAGISILVVISAIPSYGVVFQPSSFHHFFTPDAVCPKLLIIQNDSDYFYRCLRHMMWRTDESMWGLGFDGVNFFALIPITLISILLVMIMTSKQKFDSYNTENLWI